MENKIDENILQVNIISPQKKLFVGECKSLSSINNVGPFDVLPMHENFISIIRDYIIIKTKNEEKKFDIKEAVLKAEANLIYVFVGLDSVV